VIEFFDEEQGDGGRSALGIAQGASIGLSIMLRKGNSSAEVGRFSGDTAQIGGHGDPD